MDREEMAAAMERVLELIPISRPAIDVGRAPIFKEEFRNWVFENKLDDAFLLVALNNDLTLWKMHFYERDLHTGRLLPSTDSCLKRTTPADSTWTVRR